MAKQAALGRGLEALLGPDTGAVVPRPERKGPAVEEKTLSGVSEISLDTIETNPDQPRKHFDTEALQELVESIKNLGVIQPITVREIRPERYQILSGERRFRAAKTAGLATIPAFVRSTDDDDVLLIALTENIQREDLDAIEIALCYKRLMDECSFTQEQVSKRVGKKRGTVANYLRLLEQPAEVQAAIRERKIMMGHARAIAGLTKPESQLKILRKTLDENLSVRQVENLVQRAQQPPVARKAEPDRPMPEDYRHLTDTLKHYFNTTVAVKRSDNGSGSITIRFAGDEEVRVFLTRLQTIQQNQH
ncbi:MAG: ParB/RepB/Spo0J family partition protein [Prevotellaceae bacterium]|jgi:ParB family chromosome partitioning protein|nr:ParB/RepB/Spo0J family partition protein [Prevotellaceae bacterium]